MKEEIFKKTKEMAREAGYHDTKRLGKWNNYEIIEPVFTDNEMHCIGIPQFILVDGKTMRWTENESESFAIMNELQQ